MWSRPNITRSALITPEAKLSAPLDRTSLSQEALQACGQGVVLNSYYDILYNALDLVSSKDTMRNGA